MKANCVVCGKAFKTKCSNKKACGKECRKKWKSALGRKYYEVNLEKHKEASRKWYADNPEKAKESNRKWCVANPERAKKRKRRWEIANRETVLEYQRTYRAMKALEQHGLPSFLYVANQIDSRLAATNPSNPTGTNDPA